MARALPLLPTRIMVQENQISRAMDNAFYCSSKEGGITNRHIDEHGPPYRNADFLHRAVSQPTAIKSIKSFRTEASKHCHYINPNIPAYISKIPQRPQPLGGNLPDKDAIAVMFDSACHLLGPRARQQR